MERDEIISAALDGERVNLEILRAALASAAGKETAAEFILLRAAVSADRDEEPSHAETRLTRHEPSASGWRRIVSLRLPAAAAASLILVAAAAFWAGQAWRQPALDAARSGRAAPATLQQPDVASSTRPPGDPQALDTAPPPGPPEPVRVLRFTPGVDWHEGS